jgi:hypothetical protein
MTQFLTEGRAPVRLDTTFHATTPLPVDIGSSSVVAVVSGVISLDPGDIQIGAVEIKNAITDDRATVDASGRLYMSLQESAVTITADTELPAAVALASDMANPTVPQVGSHLMIYDTVDSNWDRWPAYEVDVDTTAVGTSQSVPMVLSFIGGGSGGTGSTYRKFSAAADFDGDNWGTDWALTTAAGVRGFNGTTWDRIRGTAADGLQVDSELPAAVALSDTFANPTAPAVGSFNMGWSKTLGQWVRLQTMDAGGFDYAPATDDGVQVVFAGVGGENGSSWTMASVATSVADGQLTSSYGLNVNSLLRGFNGTTWDRVRIDPDGNLKTTVASGLFLDTEFPAASALSDTFANPTTTSVGSMNMAWNEVLGQWVRVQSMDSTVGSWNASTNDGVMNTYAITAGSVSNGNYVSIGAALPNADAKAVTRYGLDSIAMGYGFNGVTWDRLRSSGTNADAEAVSTLGALSTSSHLMAYHEQNDQWERVRSSQAPTSDAQTAADMGPVLGVGSYPMVFNGTTWDRQRGANATGSADVWVTNNSTPNDVASTHTGLRGNSLGMLYYQAGNVYHRARADATGKAQVSLYGQDVAAGDTAISVTSQGYVENVPRVDATVLRSAIAVSGIGSNTLVTASGGLRIKLLSVMLSAAGTVDARFESGGGADLSGDLTLDAAGAGFVLNPPASQDMHWMESAVGEALVLNLDTATYVGGMLTYYYEA